MGQGTLAHQALPQYHTELPECGLSAPPTQTFHKTRNYNPILLQTQPFLSISFQDRLINLLPCTALTSEYENDF